MSEPLETGSVFDGNRIGVWRCPGVDTHLGMGSMGERFFILASGRDHVAVRKGCGLDPGLLPLWVS